MSKVSSKTACPPTLCPPTLCPTCNARLNSASQTGSLRFCLACNSIDRSEEQKSKLDRSALFAMVLGVVSFSFLVGAFFGSGGPPVFGYWLFCLLLGSIAITRGIRALDRIDLPHNRRKGRAAAWCGICLGVVTFFAPMGLFSWYSTVGVEHILNENSVTIRPPGSTTNRSRSVLEKLSASSIAFDKSKDVNGYQSLMSSNFQWRVYHPVNSDPKTVDPDFHTTFMAIDFDDGDWMQVTDAGDGVGYGDARYGHQLRQPDQKADRRTAYFRTTFETDVPLSSLVLQTRMDDGFFFYLDGIHRLSANIPSKSKEGYYTMASSSISGDDELSPIATEIDQAFAAGSHTVALSLHNVANSSDLGLQRFKLYGLPADAPKPTVQWDVAAPSPLGKLPEASIAFDESKDVNGYQPLLPSEIQWRVHHPMASDPKDADPDFHTTFMASGFDDAGWMEVTDNGDGVGYGDERYGHKLTRPSDVDDRKTVYFRTAFETDVPFSRVVIQMRMDDGAMVYIDGQRIWSANMLPGSKEEYRTLAARPITTTFEEKTIAVEMEHRIEPGSHVFAISLHNVARSSDLGLQRVMLYGLPADGPEPTVDWNVAADQTTSGRNEDDDSEDDDSESDTGPSE